jgi:SAM-dependent methyltransferase
MLQPNKSIFDSQAAAYDAWFDQEGKFIFASETKSLQQILPSLPRPWLEVGTGSGRFLKALGIDFGLDLSIRLLEIARSRNAPVLLGTGELMPFRNSSFGTVFLITTLCFAISPSDILHEIARVLKQDGKLVLGIILRESKWGQLYQEKKEAGHPFYKHATFYSYEEIKYLLKQDNFHLEEITATLQQNQGKVNRIELLQQGSSPRAGFTITMASRLLRTE